MDVQVRADTIYERTELTDRIIVVGRWSDPIYINASLFQPTPLPSSDDDDDGVPAYAYYIIGFGLGLLIAIIILIAVCVLCCNIRDRWYDKTECVSINYLAMLPWDYQLL